MWVRELTWRLYHKFFDDDDCYPGSLMFSLCKSVLLPSSTFITVDYGVVPMYVGVEAKKTRPTKDLCKLCEKRRK